jgi:hypothetical protein
MGAFCVFGISMTECLRMAEKKTPEVEKDKPISIEEWARRRDKLARELFDSSDKRKKVSPEFDAPQFCESWLAVDPSHIRLPKIMARGPKIDKNGDVVIRNGVPVQTWVEYEATITA